MNETNSQAPKDRSTGLDPAARPPLTGSKNRPGRPEDHELAGPEADPASTEAGMFPSAAAQDLSALREYVDQAIHQINLTVQGHIALVSSRLSGIEPQIRRAQADSSAGMARWQARWETESAEFRSSIGTAISQVATGQTQISESLTRLSGRTDRQENQIATMRNESLQRHNSLATLLNDRSTAIGGEQTQQNARLAALEEAIVRLETHLAVAQADLEAERQRHSSLEVTWQNSPLATRLAFVKNLLPREHTAARAIASALDVLAEMSDQDQFAARFTSFPQRTADTLSPLLLMPDTAEDVSPLTLLCLNLIAEVRQVFESVCASLGIELIVPRTGDPMDGQCQLSGPPLKVTGTAPTITRVKRVGFRRNGELLLPVLITVVDERENEPHASPPSPAAQDVPETPPSPASDIGDIDAVERAGTERAVATPAAGAEIMLPIFLRKMAHVAEMQGNTRAQNEMAALQQVAEFLVSTVQPSTEDLRAQIETLLPIFSMAPRDIPETWRNCIRGDNFNQIRDFLRAHGIEMILPGNMVAIDARTMITTEEVPTPHAHNVGQVARINRVGFRRGEQILFPAQVACYVKGNR